MKAPVVLFTYNRLNHTMQTIKALHNNWGSNEAELYVFADGAKDPTEEAKVNAVREYLKEVKECNWFASMTIYFQEKNLGLEKSIISGVGKIINQYGKAIVLEDDIITTPDFLSFMNKALDAFEKDPKVWSISTWLINNRKIKNCKEDILWTYRGECWGWASWADRWNRVDWSVGDYREFEKSRKRQRAFNRGGRDMSRLLQLQQEGEIHSWAIRWCYQQYKEDMITVFPKYPKSYNIGLDGSGTNCGGETTRLPKTQLEKTWNFQYSKKNTVLLKELQKKRFFEFWRQKLGGYWYALAEVEHCLICRKNNEEFLTIKAGVIKDYRSPMICEVQGEKYIFATRVKKNTLQKSVALFHLNQRNMIEKEQILLEDKASREFLSLLYMREKYYLLTRDCKNDLYVFYEMGQDVFTWKKYAVLEITENLVNAVATYINDRVYLTGSLLEGNADNRSVFAKFEIVDFFNSGKISSVLKWKGTDSNYYSIHAGNWFYREGVWYRVLEKSTRKQRGKSVIIEEIVENTQDGTKTKMLEEITVNSVECELPAFIYRKLGVSAYSCLEGYEVTELLVQHFSLGRLGVKLIRRIQR